MRTFGGYHAKMCGNPHQPALQRPISGGRSCDERTNGRLRPGGAAVRLPLLKEGGTTHCLTQGPGSLICSERTLRSSMKEENHVPFKEIARGFRRCFCCSPRLCTGCLSHHPPTGGVVRLRQSNRLRASSDWRRCGSARCHSWLWKPFRQKHTPLGNRSSGQQSLEPGCFRSQAGW